MTHLISSLLGRCNASIPMSRWLIRKRMIELNLAGYKAERVGTKLLDCGHKWNRWWTMHARAQLDDAKWRRVGKLSFDSLLMQIHAVGLLVHERALKVTSSEG